MYPQSYACYQNKKGRHCNKGVKGKRHGQLPKEGFPTMGLYYDRCVEEGVVSEQRWRWGLQKILG